MIKFVVIGRKLVERSVYKDAPERVLRKAVRVTFHAEGDINGANYENESLGHANFETLIPFSEYDRYPIDSEFMLIPKDEKLLVEWIHKEFSTKFLDEHCEGCDDAGGGPDKECRGIGGDEYEP